MNYRDIFELNPAEVQSLPTAQVERVVHVTRSIRGLLYESGPDFIREVNKRHLAVRTTLLSAKAHTLAVLDACEKTLNP